MIYLASPYTHKQPHISELRFQACCFMVTYLLKNTDNLVYSPLAHCHSVQKYTNIEVHYDKWMSHCLEILKNCERMFICDFPGYESSEGVLEETNFCVNNNIPFVVLFCRSFLPKHLSSVIYK